MQMEVMEALKKYLNKVFILFLAVFLLLSPFVVLADRKQIEGESYYMAQPEDVKLKGTVRKESISSSIGHIELRWPRKVELLFGRTPRTHG